MEKTTLYCTYSNYGKDAIMFINRTTLNNGDYDFFGKQSKVFKTLIDARKAVENGFKKWDNYYGD